MKSWKKMGERGRERKKKQKSEKVYKSDKFVYC